MTTCRGCGNTEAYHKRAVWFDGDVEEICDKCGNLPMIDAYVPDAYVGHIGQTFQNLTDKMGRPIEIQSKRHKKEVMDRLGVSEAGDKVGGRDYGSTSWIEGSRDYRKRQFAKERPALRKIFKDWKEKSRGSR